MPKRPAPQNPQLRRASKRLRIKHAQFPRFKELPTEIRLQIWLTAVHQATVDRSIHVNVHTLLHETEHSCFTSNGVFCGQHGNCSTFGNVHRRSSLCMANGYFSSTKMLSDPEDAISSPALAGLNLACRESRTAVLKLYPKVLKIFQRQWHPGAKSRLVRCRPETDILVIYAVPEVILGNIQDYSTVARWRLMTEAKMNDFPNNERQFSAFKDTIASFQHVAMCAHGDNGNESDDETNQDQTLYNIWPEADCMSLLLFFKSLKHLYFWVDPLRWPCASWRDGVRSNNIEDIEEDIESTMHGAETLRNGAKTMHGEILEFLNDYNLAVKTQIAHSMADDAHWVPQPQLLKRMGYCFPEFWYMMMRLKASDFPNLSFDVATTDAFKSIWLKYGKRGFRS